MRNLYGFDVRFTASIGIAAVIYASVRKSLVDLLDEVARLPAATTSYSRLFLICVFFMALSTHAYYMLKNNVPDQDPGADYFDRRDRAKVAKRLMKRLENPGLRVEVSPAA